MAHTPPTIGQPEWGATLNQALADIDGGVPRVRIWEAVATSTATINFNTPTSLNGTAIVFDVERPAVALVSAVFDIRVSTAGNTNRAFCGGLLVDDTTQPPGLAICDGLTLNARSTLSASWVVEFDPGEHRLRLVAYRGAASGGTTDPVYVSAANQTRYSVTIVEQ